MPEGGIKALIGPGLEGYWEPQRACLAWLERNSEEFRKAVKEVAIKFPAILDLRKDISLNFLDQKKWFRDITPGGRRFAWIENLFWYPGKVGFRPLVFTVPISGFAEMRYEKHVVRTQGEEPKITWKKTRLPPLPFKVKEEQAVIACTHVSFLDDRPVWRLLTQSLTDVVVKAATHHHRSPWLVAMDFEVKSLVA